MLVMHACLLDLNKTIINYHVENDNACDGRRIMLENN